MTDYKEMYAILFNEISRAIEALQRAQRKTEELYISSADTAIKIAAEKDEEDRK